MSWFRRIWKTKYVISISKKYSLLKRWYAYEMKSDNFCSTLEPTSHCAPSPVIPPSLILCPFLLLSCCYQFYLCHNVSLASSFAASSTYATPSHMPSLCPIKTHLCQGASCSRREKSKVDNNRGKIGNDLGLDCAKDVKI